MSERLILPPNYPVDVEGPVIFLAGPIQGAMRWQEAATHLIHSEAPKLWIASPRRLVDRLQSDFVYEEQVDWETHFIRRAGLEGLILFWLAKEEVHYCDRPHAQTSRFEIGEWKVRHERDNVKLLVGIEPGFSNERYIRRRFSQDCPDIYIHSSLNVLCTRAVEEIRK